MFKHILLPTDGSQLARDTAVQAVGFAKEAGAKITALYVRPIVSSENYGDLIEPDVLDRLAVGTDAKAREYLGFIRKLCEAAAVECTPIALVSDTPWEVIVNVAEDCTCDLIFMSKHGRSSSLTSLLLGSETHRVLTHSNIPVLVYRPPGIGARRRKAKAGSGTARLSNEQKTAAPVS